MLKFKTISKEKYRIKIYKIAVILIQGGNIWKIENNTSEILAL